MIKVKKSGTEKEKTGDRPWIKTYAFSEFWLQRKINYYVEEECNQNSRLVQTKFFVAEEVFSTSQGQTLILNCGKDSSPCEAVHWTERSEGSRWALAKGE